MTFKPFCIPSIAALAARAAIENAAIRVAQRRADKYASDLEAAAERIGVDLTTREGYEAAAAAVRRSKQAKRGNETRQRKERLERIKRTLPLSVVGKVVK
jgi:hypothetical protein